MKLVIAILLLLTGSLFSQEKFETLKLVNGKTYNKVEVTEKTPAGISIRHEAGTARIKFKDMLEADVKTLGGYDPKVAEEYQRKQQELEAAQNRAMDAELAKLAKSGKTEQQQLEEVKKQTETSKTLTPEEKAKRLQLVTKKLDTLKLQKSKGLR